MSNTISFYQQRNVEFVQRAMEPRQAAPTGANVSRESSLSADEQRMIQQFFPSSPAMSLRVYGPDRSERAVQPAAVGGRLDIRG